MEWKNVYRGFLMGASDVIPGVSGGTIAVLLGIYDRLIAAISGLLSKDWKKQLSFLIPLGVGVATAVLLMSRVIEWLFIHYPGPTKFFFLGLIIGILPYLFEQADAKRSFKTNHYLLLLIWVIAVGSLAFLNPTEGDIITNVTTSTYILLFFSGIAGSAAMILPGISGSFMLLVIGVYSTVISAISNLQLDIMAVTGAGIVIGLVTMTKIIDYFLKSFYTATFAIIIGFVIGSIAVVFQGWPATTGMLLLSIGTFALGLLVAFILSRVEYKE